MLPAESKLKILESYYGLDLAIFKAPLDKVDTCCPVLKEEYVVAKGALLSLMVEMYDFLGHQPAVITEDQVPDKAGLQKLALESVKIANSKAKAALITEDSKKSIMKSISESAQLAKKGKKNIDLETLLSENVKARMYKNSIDNLLLLETFKDCKSRDKIKTHRGKTLYEAYRILRDNLIRVANEVVEEN